MKRTSKPRTTVNMEGAGTGGAPIPRYLRRQGLQEGGRAPNPKVDDEDWKKPLDPYILAKRIRKFCEEGKVDDAVAYLKNAPRDAMNTIVWNTMLWEAMKVSRFQLAYSLYIDVSNIVTFAMGSPLILSQMKRRGLSPTTRTYQTMFNGLARIDRWSSHPKQLENARSLYEDFTRHIESLKKHEPYHPDITPTPLASYLKILGNSGEYQEVFDVYYALDTTGSYAPNEFVYAAMFQALADMRIGLSGKGITAPGHWGARVASDTRKLWTHMMKGTQHGSPGHADAYAATAAISALSQGDKTDHELAFQIARDWFGLSKEESSKVRGHFPLGRQSLGAILRLCNEAEDYATCMQFFQMIKRNERGVAILDRLHVEEVLKARYHLSPGGLGLASLQLLEWMLQRERAGHGPHIRPAGSTYHLVLSACWKAGDWPSAATAFNLMTGFRPNEMTDEFAENGAIAKFDKREPGRNIWPTVEALSSLMRTAVATKQRWNIRAAFRLLDTIGLDTVVPKKAKKTEVPLGEAPPGTVRAAKNHRFFATKLAQATEEGWDIIKGYANECTPQEFQKWKEVKERLNKDFNKQKGYTPTKLV